MSQRSIMEINHDQSGAIALRPDLFTRAVLRALASGSDEAWNDLAVFGIKRIVQCHHTEDRKVVVGAGGLKREYPFG